MIASLEGRIQVIQDQFAVISVKGVGFKVSCPQTFLLEHEVGDEVFILTQMIVRENDLSLYGFSNEDERKTFNLLLAVDGIGPKAAMNVLSKLTIEALTNAIATEDVDTLSKVPGIGKKTAQKIALYLKDKVDATLVTATLQAPVNQIHEDLLSALLNLGYTRQEAQQAIQRLPTEPKLSLEESLLHCLNLLQSI